MAPEAETPITPLFRNEVLRFRAARLQGEVLLKIRSPWLVVGFACVALAVIVIVASALIPFDRKERATGALVLEANTGQLEAQLRIAATSIGFVKRGQPVRLRYDAFPDRRFGGGNGKVESVSLLPAADGSYGARVSLQRDYVQAFGDRIALQPGMSFTCEIVIERRSMLAWLFEPWFAVGARS